MSRPAQTPSAALGVAVADRGIRDSAQRNRQATAPAVAAHRRRRGCVLVGLLGGVLLLVAPVDGSCARSRMEQARSSPVATSAGDADDSAPAVTTRIGRLFSSPEQRIELDRLRNDPDSGKDAASEQVEAPAIPRNGIAKRPRQPSPFAATFNGIFVRNDGHLVTWVDERRDRPREPRRRRASASRRITRPTGGFASGCRTTEPAPFSSTGQAIAMDARCAMRTSVARPGSPRGHLVSAWSIRVAEQRERVPPPRSRSRRRSSPPILPANSRAGAAAGDASRSRSTRHGCIGCPAGWRWIADDEQSRQGENPGSEMVADCRMSESG